MTRAWPAFAAGRYFRRASLRALFCLAPAGWPDRSARLTTMAGVGLLLAGVAAAALGVVGGLAGPRQCGFASWYGLETCRNEACLTASGEPFDRWAMTAAHRTLEFGTRVKITAADPARGVNPAASRSEAGAPSTARSPARGVNPAASRSEAGAPSTARSPARGIIVTINDRGPFVAGRIVDLSRGAARALGIERAGIARVCIEVLD